MSLVCLENYVLYLASSRAFSVNSVMKVRLILYYARGRQRRVFAFLGEKRCTIFDPFRENMISFSRQRNVLYTRHAIIFFVRYGSYRGLFQNPFRSFNSPYSNHNFLNLISSTTPTSEIQI